MSWSLAGCTGVLGEGPSGSFDPTAPVPGAAPSTGETSAQLRCDGTPPDVGPSLLRRLSNVELQLTLQDLFALDAPPSVDEVPLDNDRDGFKTFADVQALSAQHLRAYADVSRRLADALLADGARRSAVVGCTAGEASCLRTFVEKFGRLAYRRALAPDELATLVTRAETNGLDATDQLRYAIQSVLTSPSFLYRVEVGDTPEGLSQLSASELAAKLSFALWGRGPSTALLQAAEDGALKTAEGLREMAWEMLGDPRASHFYRSFFRQWLGYDRLRAPVVPGPGWADSLMPAMQAEADAVLLKHAFGAGDFHDALRTDETTLSSELADYYGLPAPGPDGSVQVPMSHPRSGAGILGHAAILSLKTDGDMVALRGNWLRRTFFCSSLHIPPEVASELGDLLVGLSPVQIVKKRNTEASCKGCHALIDPIGVGLAHFDAGGRFSRDLDIAQYGIEPTLPDLASRPFASLGDLSDALTEAPAVDHCLSEKVFIYMSGRVPSASDQCGVEDGLDAFAHDFDFRALLAGAVATPGFRLRRAAAPIAQGAME